MTLEIERLRQENASLKYENSILIGQIDKLNARSIKIRKQNEVLSEKIAIIEKNNIELQKVQQEKEDFFSMIVHDIKNPTIIIKNLIELLSSFGTLTAEQQEVVKDLVDSAQHIISLSNDISQVLALEGTSLHMFYEITSPKDIIGDVVRRNSVNAEYKQQTITTSYQEDMPKFTIDAKKIVDVLDNLVSNAIKYTQHGGKIQVNAQKNGDDIEISVIDNGLGMSEEDLKHAFKRGAKLSAVPTGNEFSSGLGLWIVKRIIDAHRGKVWIKSTLGRGTTFVVSLPIIANTGAAEFR